MESANGVTGDKGGPPPPPSPLTGCYLLIVVGEPYNEQHKDIILQKISKGLLSWELNECMVDLEKELAIITEQALEGEEARYGERLIQFASENLVTEILIHPAVSTLAQCMRNLLSSFTRHRHIIHAGYTFAANGSWALQDGTFSYVDFSEAFQEVEVQRVIRAYENGITMDIHCAPEGDWPRLPKEAFAKACKVRMNPADVLTSGSPSISGFVEYLSPFLIPTALENLLESSDVVGNIRFSRPTLYVFPGGQGDAALFGINGFNMLLDGGYSRKACFWDFVRHLDRLDAVLMTRLNNSNVGGISSVLRRKKQDALYPQIGHFFCNIQERKAILSPDGDKDKDPLLINLLEEGQDIISNLRHLNLNPQVCYRDSEPINLYHKVGHGTLDMYVLSPAKDSKEVREFMLKWNQSDQKLFANTKSSRDFNFPIQNLISISALLVWRPANPSDTITRILYPGSCPQNKILEGLDRLKNLEFIKHPTCSEKSLAPISTVKKTAKEAIFDKIIPKDRIAMEKKENKLIENDTPLVNGDAKEKEKTVKKSDSTESDRSTKVKKSEEPKIIENGDKPKSKPKAQKLRSDSLQRKKQPEKKSPTFSKKPIENGDVKKAIKQSPITTPAKSAKDANNRKVVESKVRKEVAKVQAVSEVKPKIEKIERKPISRRPPSKKLPLSPAKKIVNGVQKPDSISRKGKLDKEGTTDSSTVSTPSADQESVLKKDISKLTPEELQQMKAQELAELKEEQEAVKEIEAVFRKGEVDKNQDETLRKVKDISIDDKLEAEEYLIIEKEEIEHDSIEDKETKDENQKLARDSEESEKQRKSSTEEQEEEKQKIQEQLNATSAEIEDTPKTKPEPTPPSKVTSPEEKADLSTDKKTTDKDGDEEVKDIAESQPDEKVSANIKSGDTTTAPTLPEDERIPLDEIKEDNGAIEEKYVKEDTKEKEVPTIHVPPKTFESVTKLPSVVGIHLDKQKHIRDIVKTPDEVADLPVHEEVDYEYTHELKAETPRSNEVVENKIETETGFSKEQAKEEEQEKDKDEFGASEVDTKKSILMQAELKTLTDTVLQNESLLEKDILNDSEKRSKEATEEEKKEAEGTEIREKEIEKHEEKPVEAEAPTEEKLVVRKKRSLETDLDDSIQKEESKEESPVLIEKADEVQDTIEQDTPVSPKDKDTKDEIKLEPTAEEDKKEMPETGDQSVQHMKESSDQLKKIDEKLQNLKDALVEPQTKVDASAEEKILDEIEKVADILSDVDKLELGRKSPKEREEDVMKIVVGVAEVLKSEAPLEEFQGKIPITTSYSSYTEPYISELRETHITTVDSPTIEMKVINTDIPTIPEEPHSVIASFLEEERKIAPVHAADPVKAEDKRNSLLKESQELMMATSKMLSDIKSAKSEETKDKHEEDMQEDDKQDDDKQDEDVTTVHRMLVTASSEDGGEETEICPPGTITFSRSSESSGRSSPDPAHKVPSQKSSIVDTISDTLSTVRQVEDLHSEKDSGIDEQDKEESKIKEDASEKAEERSGKSSPDKDASLKSIASGKSTPDLSELERSKEVSSFEEAKKEPEEKTGILDQIGKKIEETLSSVEALIQPSSPDAISPEITKQKVDKVADVEDLVKSQKIEKIFEETSYSISASPTKVQDERSKESIEDKETPEAEIDEPIKDIHDITTKSIEDQFKENLQKLSIMTGDLIQHDGSETVHDATTKDEIVPKDFRQEIEDIKSKIQVAATSNDVIEETTDKDKHVFSKDNEKEETFQDVLKDGKDKEKVAFLKENEADAIESIEDLSYTIKTSICIAEDLTKTTYEMLHDKTQKIEEAIDSTTTDIIDDAETTLKHKEDDSIHKINKEEIDDLSKQKDKIISDIKDTIDDKKEKVEPDFTGTLDSSKIEDKIEAGIHPTIKNEFDTISNIADEIKKDFVEITSHVEDKIGTLKSDPPHLTKGEQIKVDIHESVKENIEHVDKLKEEIIDDGVTNKENLDEFRTSAKHIIESTTEVEEKLKAQVHEETGKTVEEVDEIMEQIAGTEERVFETTQELADQFNASMRDIIQSGFTDAGEYKNKAGTAIEEQYEKTQAGVVESAKVIKEDIKDLKSPFDDIAKEVSDIKDEITTKAEDTKEDILHKTEQMKSTIEDQVGDVLNDITKSKDDLEKQILDSKDTKDELIKEIDQFQSDKLEKTDKLTSSIQQQIETSADSVSEKLGDVLEDIKDSIGKQIEHVDEKQDVLVREMEEVKEDIAQAKDDLVQDIKDAKRDILLQKDDLVTDIKDAKEDILLHKDDLVKDIKDLKEDIDLQKDELAKDIKDAKEDILSKKDDLVKDAKEHILLEKDYLVEDFKETKANILLEKDNLVKEIKDAKEDVLSDAHDLIKTAKKEVLLQKDDLIKNIKDAKQDVLSQKDDLVKDLKDSKEDILTQKDDVVKDIEVAKEDILSEADDLIKDKKEEILLSKDNLIKDIKDAKEDMLSQKDHLVRDVKDVKEDILSQAEDLVKGAKEDIVSHKDELEKGIKDAKEDILSQKDHLEKEAKDVKEDILSQAEDLVKGAKEDIVPHKDKLQKGIKGAKEDIISQKDHLVRDVKDVKEDILSQAEDLVKGAKEDIVSHKDELEKGIKDAKEDILSQKDHLVKETKDVKEDILSQAEDLVKGAKEDIVSHKDELETDIKDAREDILSQKEHLVKEAKDVKEDILSQAEDLVKGAKEDIVSHKDELEKGIKDAKEHILSQKDHLVRDAKDVKEDILSHAEDLVKGAKADIVSHKDELEKCIKDAKENVLSQKDHLVKEAKDVKEDFLSQAEDLVKGAKEDIVSHKDELEKDIKDAKEDILSQKDHLVKEAKYVKENILSQAEDLVKGAKEDIVSHKDQLEKGIKDATEDILSQKDHLVGDVKDLKEDIPSQAEDLVKGAKKDIVSHKDELEKDIKDAKEDILSQKDHLVGDVKDLKEDFLSQAEDLVEGAKEDIVSHKDELAKYIKDAKEDVLSQKDHLVEDVKDLKEDFLSHNDELVKDIKDAKEDILLRKDDLIKDIKDKKENILSQKDDIVKDIHDAKEDILDEKEKLTSAITQFMEDGQNVLKEKKDDLIKDIYSKKEDILSTTHEMGKQSEKILEEIADSAAETKKNLLKEADDLKTEIQKDLSKQIKESEESILQLGTASKTQVEEAVDKLDERKDELVKDVEDTKENVLAKTQELSTSAETKLQESIDDISEKKQDLIKEAESIKDNVIDQKEKLETTATDQFQETVDKIAEEKDKLAKDIFDKKDKVESAIEEKIDGVIKQKDEFLEDISQHKDELKSGIEKTIQSTKSGLANLNTSLESECKEAKDHFKDQQEKIVAGVSDKVQTTADSLSKTKDDLDHHITDTKEKLKSDIQEAVDDLDKTKDKFRDSLAENIQGIKKEIKDGKDEKIEDVKQGIVKLSENIQDVKSDMIKETELVQKSIGDKIDETKTVLYDLKDDIKDKKDKLEGEVSTKVTETKENIIAQASNVAETCDKDIHDTVEAVQDKTDGFGDKLQEGISDSLQSISGFTKSLFGKSGSSSTSNSAKVATDKNKEEKSPSEKETMDEKSDKKEQILMEGATDLNDTMEKVVDMSQSMIFEKCDVRADDVKENEKKLEDITSDLEETYETVEKLSKSTSFEKCDTPKADSTTFDETFKKVEDMTKSMIFEKCDSIDKRASIPEASGVAEGGITEKEDPRKVSLEKEEEFEKGEKETMEKTKKESIKEKHIPPSIEIAQQEKISTTDKYEAKTVELCDKQIELKAEGSTKTETEQPDDVQDNLLHEKQFPDRATPPTVPVSPNITDEVKFSSTSDILSKEIESRGSDPETLTSLTDVSSEQFSRPGFERESDEEDEQYSITSQVAHSRDSSHGDFDLIRTQDPMSMSFYGALPDEEAADDLNIESSGKLAETPTDKTDNKKKEAQPSSSTSQEKTDPIESWGKPLGLPAPTYLYEITKAKYSSPGIRGRLESTKEDSSLLDRSRVRQSQNVDMMTASFYGDLPTHVTDPIHSWGKPLGLPSPAAPNDNKGTPKKEKKLPASVTAKNKLNDDKKRAESPSKYNKNKKINPVYVDLTYVPHHGNAYYAYVDFFRKVRARYYVFSGIEPSREVYSALLEAKQTWEDKELEVTIIPTYDTDILGYWVAENEELLTKYKIDLSPSASRCTINLQDHETSCSAYRLEF